MPRTTTHKFKTIIVGHASKYFFPPSIIVVSDANTQKKIGIPHAIIITESAAFFSNPSNSFIFF